MIASGDRRSKGLRGDVEDEEKDGSRGWMDLKKEFVCGRKGAEDKLRLKNWGG